MLEMPRLVGAPGSSAGGRGRAVGTGCSPPNPSNIPQPSRSAALTWGHPRGDGGGGKLALALGGHGGHLDGVGGEGGEAGDAVLQGDVG